MQPTRGEDPSQKSFTVLVTILGLLLTWALIWANLPSKEDLLSPPSQRAAAVPPVPELDLTIPGVPPAKPTGLQTRKGVDALSGGEGPTSSKADGTNTIPADRRVRRTAEVKCDAAVRRSCPDSLTGEDRVRCLEKRMKRLSPSCQDIVRQRLVR